MGDTEEYWQASRVEEVVVRIKGGLEGVLGLKILVQWTQEEQGRLGGRCVQAFVETVLAQEVLH
jgi:hypothetical protein